MAIKKYAFLALALLSSAVRANDCCYSFYVGGDLGMGIFSIKHYDNGEFADAINPDFEEAYASRCFTNSSPVFIGGGRVGLAWVGSECWYAAIEGNVHSASRCMKSTGLTVFNFSENDDEARFASIDKTKLIAGIHGQLGYRVAEDTVFYGIVGAKYLNGSFRQTYTFEEEDTLFENIDLTRCYSNWGWTAGFGYLANLWCNWDLRLEALYAQFQTRCFNNAYVFRDGLEAENNRINVKPRLFYGVVSLCYNF